MKNSNFETLVKPVIVLVVICLITSTMLAVTNNATAPIIAAQEEAAAQEAYQAVLPEADSFTDLTSEVSTENIVAVVKANNGAGYCVKATGKGYGGAVPVVIGFDNDGNILGVQFLQNSESAGFGMRLWDSSGDGAVFADELVGKSGSVTLKQDGVNGLTGATISSKAVISATNSAFACIDELKAKEGAGLWI